MEYMDTVMSRISEIEAAAVAIADHAALRKKEIAREYEKKIRRMDETMDAQTDEKLNQLRRDLEEKAARELAHMKTATEEYLQGLEEEYRDHHGEISETILRKVIGE